MSKEQDAIAALKADADRYVKAAEALAGNDPELKAVLAAEFDRKD